MIARRLTDLLREAHLRGATPLAARAAYAAADASGLTALRLPRIPARAELALDWLRPPVESLARLIEIMDSPGRPVLLRGALDASTTPPVAAPDEVIAEADRICGGSTVVFGHSVSIDSWTRGATRVEPPRHWSRIRYRAWPAGDIKDVWELNRLEALVVLARAWRLTGEDRYVRHCCSLLDRWIRGNPPETGVNWISSLEIGIRALNVRWMHELLAPAASYNSGSRALAHFYQLASARHLARRLKFTRRTGRNNHLIGDAACLTVIAALYPEAAESRQWFDRGLRTLTDALAEQVLADGMHFELSFGYHLLVTELVLTALRACQAAGREVPAALAGPAEALVAVISAALLPDGTLPDLNDNDDGTAVPVRVGAGPRSRSILGLGSGIFSRPDWEWQARGCSEARWWLVGGRVPRPTASTWPARPPVPDVLLHAAGLSISRTSWDASADVLLFDSHRDPFPASGHDHASLLQVLLWMDGREVLIDAGTYRYNGDAEKRNRLRSSEAHNTIEVDGLPHAVARGTFGWSQQKRSEPILQRRVGNLLVLSSSHSCYMRLDEPVLHRRSVVWDGDYRCLLVIDRLDSTGHHHYVQRWQLPAQDPGAAPRQGRLGVVAQRAPVAWIDLLHGDDDDVRIHTGDSAMTADFRSRAYGTLEPRTVLLRTWSARGPCERATLISAASLAGPERALAIARLSAAARPDAAKAATSSLGSE
jgi:hypothetical protein